MSYHHELRFINFLVPISIKHIESNTKACFGLYKTKKNDLEVEGKTLVDKKKHQQNCTPSRKKHENTEHKRTALKRTKLTVVNSLNLKITV